jgi:murein DD-endopeptidase MepM/ murein hydrolase activator NlpD
MKVIFLRGIGQTCSTAIKCFYASLVIGGIGVFGAGTLALGYQLGIADVEFPEHQLLRSLRQTFAQERRMLEDAKLDAQGQIDAMALRIGQMQSHLLRLDALGERLVEMGKLDEGEFSFAESPAVGGPEAADVAENDSLMPGLVQELDQLERKISNRELQLNLLEDLIMNANLEEIIHPMGQPVKHGFISSLYGMRNDPFTGKRTMHKGIDFAGKTGSDVVAVAAGVVTQAGMQSGYGMLVEINHGKGYVTRYGHNRELLVAVGDRVKPGQVIAKMGSTGRSTGPHVHFEVLRNDKVVNPTKYIKTERNKDNA